MSVDPKHKFVVYAGYFSKDHVESHRTADGAYKSAKEILETGGMWLQKIAVRCDHCGQVTSEYIGATCLDRFKRDFNIR